MSWGRNEGGAVHWREVARELIGDVAILIVQEGFKIFVLYVSYMLDFHKVVPLWQLFPSPLAFLHFLVVRVVIAVFWHVSKVVFNLVRFAYLLLEVSRLFYLIKRTTIQYFLESLLDIRNDFCYLGQPLTVFTLRILLISAN